NPALSSRRLKLTISVQQSLRSPLPLTGCWSLLNRYSSERHPFHGLKRSGAEEVHRSLSLVRSRCAQGEEHHKLQRSTPYLKYYESPQDGSAHSPQSAFPECV